MNKATSSSSTFRELSDKEMLHTIVKDYRMIENSKNNLFIITCEHANNNFHHFEKLLSENDKRFVNTHWGYDIGALDIAVNIAKTSNLLLIHPNYSRLILDPNRPLTSTTLIREYVEENIKLDINNKINQNREERLSLFYYPYYDILYEVLSKLKPKYFISVHTFTKNYENNKAREFEVGLLFNNKNSVVKLLEEKLEKANIIYRLNEPYTAAVAFGYYSVETFDCPNITEGVLLEIRNDLAIDKDFSMKITNIVGEVVNELTNS